MCKCKMYMLDSKSLSQGFQKSVFLGTLVLECPGTGAQKKKKRVTVAKYVRKRLQFKSSFWKFDSHSALKH